MIVHTSVVTLAPLHKPRGGAPPDMLSGGGRQILASYTEFSYQGNFSDAACRLIDTLPHQSPAIARGRKKLGGASIGGASTSVGTNTGMNGGPLGGVRARAASTLSADVTGSGLSAEAGPERIRHHSGAHVFYLYVTADLGILCVTDGLPLDDEAFSYLDLVEKSVSSAVAPLGRAGGERVRKAASHALVNSMNTWTSQANGAGVDGRQSPIPIRSTTPLGSRRRNASSPELNGRYTLENCLIEAVRRLRIDRVKPRSPFPLGGEVTAAPPPQFGPPPPPPPPPSSILAPQARRPPPGLRGPLSPGPYAGMSSDVRSFGAAFGSDLTPTIPSSLPLGPNTRSRRRSGMSVSPPRSPTNVHAQAADGAPVRARETWDEAARDERGSPPVAAAPQSPKPMLVDLGFDDLPEEAGPNLPGAGSASSAAAVAVAADLASAFGDDRGLKPSERATQPRQPVLSLGPASRQQAASLLNLQRTASSERPSSKTWGSMPSLTRSDQPTASVPPSEMLRASTPPGHFYGPLLPPRGLPQGPVYGPDPSDRGHQKLGMVFAPQGISHQHHQHRQQPQPRAGPPPPPPPRPPPPPPLPLPTPQSSRQMTSWGVHSSTSAQLCIPPQAPEAFAGVPPRLDVCALPASSGAIPGLTWAHMAGLGHAATVAAPAGSGDVRETRSPLLTERSSSDPPGGRAKDEEAKAGCVRTTTVAEERLRRRRLEGLEEQQRRSGEMSADWGSLELGAEVSNSSSFRRTSSGGGLSSYQRQLSPSSGGGRSRTSDTGSSSRGHACTALRGGAASPASPEPCLTPAYRRSIGHSRGLGSGAVSPVSSANSPASSPFRRVDGARRSLTPPARSSSNGGVGIARGWMSPLSRSERRSSAAQGARLSAENRRRSPPGVDTPSGRSESVPARPRSWTGSRSVGDALDAVAPGDEAVATGAGTAVRGSSADGTSSEDEQKLGILLPLDYSGMVDEHGGAGGGEAPLLRELDGMARNALKTQVEVSVSDDDLLGVMAKFRHTLLSIPLPPPAAVDYEQALKDAQRESIEVNGRLFQGDVEELLSTLRGLVGPLVVGDETLMGTVCQDIVRASSRTSSGGDTYAVVAALLSRPTEGDLLTPSGSESAPIGISVDAADGEVVITVENSFLLRRNAMDGSGKVSPPKPSGGLTVGGSGSGGGGGGEKGSLKERMVRARGQVDDLVAQTAEQFRKIKYRKDAWVGPGWNVDGAGGPRTSRTATDASATDEDIGIKLVGRVEVYLCLLDGSSKRRLRITCPDVERCPPECMLLGAGVNEVNGTYELAGFRHGAPVYTKGRADVIIAKECLGGRHGWIIARPPNQVLYGQPGETDLPPELHWALMNGGVGQDPPPTLMMHGHRRAKERLVDIRQMPTPRQHWAIGPNVTFPEDKDHNLVGTAIIARPPTPSSPTILKTASASVGTPATSLPIW